MAKSTQLNAESNIDEPVAMYLTSGSIGFAPIAPSEDSTPLDLVEFVRNNKLISSNNGSVEELMKRLSDSLTVQQGISTEATLSSNDPTQQVAATNETAASDSVLDVAYPMQLPIIVRRSRRKRLRSDGPNDKLVAEPFVIGRHSKPSRTSTGGTSTPPIARPIESDNASPVAPQPTMGKTAPTNPTAVEQPLVASVIDHPRDPQEAIFGNYQSDQDKPLCVDRFTWPNATDVLLNEYWFSVEKLGRALESGESASRILVSSATRGEGRTTLAMVMARWAAANGKSTLLVDADIAKPFLSTQLGLNPVVCWRDICGNAQFANEVIVESSNSTIQVMPSKLNSVFGHSVAESLDHLATLLDGIQDKFEFIVVDFGPIDELTSQQPDFTAIANSAIMVNSLLRTSHEQFVSACRTLIRNGNPQIAVAENFCPAA